MIIFIASANRGKITEIKEIFKDLEIEFLSVLDQKKLKELGMNISLDFDVEETARDFKGNALLKAEAYAELTGLAVMADDSGLELMALDGFPGVESNRWMEGNAKEKNLTLLKLIGARDRKARFRTVICYFDPETNQKEFFEGEIRGKIAKEIRGQENVGFGYDPIFIPDGYDKTFSELGKEIKNQISHRSNSLKKFSKFIEKKLG